MDKGNGLFMNNFLLLGVVVHVPTDDRGITICALLHNDRKIIMDFVNKVPEACE